MPPDVRKILRKQGYQIVLRHSGVKLCYWLRRALLDGRTCYKHKFYGIRSWRCIQMSPAVIYCPNSCLYCWRVQQGDIEGLSWSKHTPEAPEAWDDPEEIAKESIKAQRTCITGYRGVNAIMKRVEEAMDPKHVAISLSGEPTLYPRLGELIEVYKKMGMTVFLVTNGLYPEKLLSLESEPTQLYVTIPAPNSEVYRKLCRPSLRDYWSRLMRTVEALSSFSCPTVMRLTLVRGINMIDPESYAGIIAAGNPTYVEPKAYMHVGYSRLRLTFAHMPTHEDIREFSEKLAAASGYDIIDESADSRVVLLSRLKKPIRFT
ncbi:MAG: 4-demethylwyosine synthase TYW1 [Thermoproteota archaeon]|nr:MAG: 4-demethylwyosine synthase TYW1 [Candidatus Korarchaeota archaeon]RLG53921.1 MAG: 4-demethylwyosine synthase TYW1 [Candidatus Korarchaeota archaeon]